MVTRSELNAMRLEHQNVLLDYIRVLLELVMCAARNNQTSFRTEIPSTVEANSLYEYAEVAFEDCTVNRFENAIEIVWA